MVQFMAIAGIILSNTVSRQAAGSTFKINPQKLTLIFHNILVLTLIMCVWNLTSIVRACS